MYFLKQVSQLGIFTLFLFFLSCQSSTQEQTEEKISEIPFTSSSEEAMNSFKAGLLLVDIGISGQEARAHFNEAIENDPNFMAAYIYRSFTSGSPEEFAADMNKAGELLEGVSDGEKTLYELSRTFMTNDPDTRMELANGFAQAFPDAARPEFWIASTYQGQQNYEQARAHYQKAIDINPDWIGGYVGLWGSYVFNEPKDFTKAVELGNKIVELQPELAASHITLGDSYRAQKNLEEARSAYAKAITVEPQNAIAHMKKGHANSFLGNFDEARSDYQEARKYDEYKGTSLGFEAYTYLYEDNYQGALDWLNAQAASLEELGVPESRMNSSKMSCINSCAWIALHHGEKEHLKELVGMATPISAEMGLSIGTDEAIAGNKATMLFWESLSAAMDGDYDAASTKAEEAKTTLEGVKNSRKLENYHFAHGYISMQQENYEEAVVHFEQSNMNNQYMKYNLALAHEMAGNTDKSMEILKEIDDFNFNNVGYAIIRNDVKRKLNTSS